LHPVTAQNQSLAAKFPAQRNREYSDVLQGKFLDEQGNFRSTENNQSMSAIGGKADIPLAHLDVRF
jgi:hypothetical protein